MFFRDNMPELVPQQEFIFNHLMMPDSFSYYHVDSNLQKIFSDVMGFCAMVNAETRTTVNFLGFEEIPRLNLLSSIEIPLIERIQGES
ncbi:hypothetical protein N7493_008520 [Penicillium malachiteum]|uniref:Uncharacterized protein n=1 Tax=Penicillium malachiteum TaxID=1324776 RepID=A0AAD6HI08_9EURO|nr:hypothetical protein N7493_008520 [Penicillium malachiteum]